MCASSVRNLAWRSLLRARAIENQCYVAGINCIGEDAWHNHYSGHSMMVKYDGEVTSEIPQEQCVSKFELSKNDLNQFRKEFPFLRDRDPIEFK